MSEEHFIVRAGESAAGPSSAVPLAKARLLAWAAQNSAQRHKAQRRLGKIAAGGALAVIGGMAVARVVLGPRRRGSSAQSATARTFINGAMLARAGMWLIPIAARAVQAGWPGTRTPTRAPGSVLLGGSNRRPIVRNGHP